MKEVEISKACSTHGRDEKRMQKFGRKTRRQVPDGRPTRRWENNIRMDLKEIGWEGVE
jgi:hypothetical protein